MIEICGDIWEYYGSAVLSITTSGTVAKDGRAVLGRGVARQAAARFPWLADELGKQIERNGNHVLCLHSSIVSFPVEETAWSLPDLAIIERSARELKELADKSGWSCIVVPRPGCGGGGLSWKDVKPRLEPWLDNRFLIICPC